MKLALFVLKAFASTFSTLSGSVTPSRLVQLKNASSPIVFKLLDKVISCNSEPAKAFLPIYSIVSGKVTFSTFESSNAELAIPTTGLPLYADLISTFFIA